MKSEQGYYALVQYSEFPERAEYVNVGIVLFAPGPLRVFCRFVSRPNRVNRVFRANLGVDFRLQLEALENRLAHEFGQAWNRERIEAFSDLRSGKLRLSSLRSILVRDAKTVADDLFAQLVGEIPHQQRGRRLSTRLADEFRRLRVEQYLSKPAPVQLSGGIKVEAPFGYQNGRFNLIDGVSLSGDPDKVLSKVSPKMIEGELLFKEEAFAPKQLIVVGDDFDGQRPDFIDLLHEQMARNSVKFFTMDHIEDLARDIRASAIRH